jgi:hypothetical protein
LGWRTWRGSNPHLLIPKISALAATKHLMIQAAAVVLQTTPWMNQKHRTTALDIRPRHHTTH